MALGWKVLKCVISNSLYSKFPHGLLYLNYNYCIFDKEGNSLGDIPSRNDLDVRTFYSRACLDGIYYEVGKWVLPSSGYGPLAVFDTYEHARAYTDGFGIIFPCEYIPSSRTHLYNKIAVYDEELPIGTVLADAVRVF